MATFHTQYKEIGKRLRDALKSQTTLKDYDFEASNLSVLIDTLAVNSYTQNLYANMLLNDSFASTARTKTALYEHAFIHRYVPRSRVASLVGLKITIPVGTNPIVPKVIIPAGTNFTGQLPLGGSREFSTNHQIKCLLNDDRTHYESPEFVVYGGTYREYNFNVNIANQRFVIKDSDIDLNTLKVRVKRTGQTVYENYTITNIVNGDKNNRIVSLKKGDDDFYELIFADHILGKGVDVGDEIECTFISVDKDNAGGAKGFTVQDLTDGIGLSRQATVETFGKATDGGEHETTDELNESIIQASEGMLVTPKDFIIATKKIIGSYSGVTAWRGSDMSPPQPNYVYIAVKVGSHGILSENIKKFVIDNLSKQTLPSIGIRVVDVNTLNVMIDVKIKIDNDISLSVAEINDTLEKALDKSGEFGNPLLRYDIDKALSTKYNYIKDVNYVASASTDIAINKGTNFKEFNFGSDFKDVKFSSISVGGIESAIYTDNSNNIILKQNDNEKIVGVIDSNSISFRGLPSDKSQLITVKVTYLNEDIYPPNNTILNCNVSGVQIER